MGKGGRIACIFLPYVLTVASLVCIILVGLGTTKTSSPLNEIYFVRADLSQLKTDVSDISDSLSSLQKGLQQAEAAHDLHDFYTIGLWNYCYGSKKDGNFDFEGCSPREAKFWFNPTEVWKLPDQVQNLYPKALNNGLSAYKHVAGWLFVAYVIAFVATVVELVVGITAVFSRWGSFATTIVSGVSSVFTVAASVTATALYAVLVGAMNEELKPLDIHAIMGKDMFAITWLASAFSLGAGLFWLFSVCCCSGRSPYHHSNRGRRGVTAEKTPYTYERVGSPFLGAQNHGSSMPMHNMQPGRDMAYEPYRHEQRV